MWDPVGKISKKKRDSRLFEKEKKTDCCRFRIQKLTLLKQNKCLQVNKKKRPQFQLIY